MFLGLTVTASLAEKYRSLFVVGRGGMGSVEAALAIDSKHVDDPEGDQGNGDRSAYERIVALKRLLPDAARDKRRVEMFLREARLAAMLDHPNVVSAYDYGELNGELYLAMEYVEGQPLSRLLRTLADAKEKLAPTVIAYVLAEICKGLHAAHELTDKETKQPLNLVHRDVSPQNVMLGYDGRVRLLDFGVAKIETENVTKTGEVKGKTAYMSPEQAMGDPIDRRSDLFGVGAILFECFALRRMWGDGTDMDVIRKLALESPPKLEDALTTTTKESELPRGLSDLYAKLVAREAKDRPASAKEAADAFMAFVEDQDAAQKSLREILDAHFADQAKEQRTRLTTSLHEVAPAQADELRESVLPTTPLAATPILNRQRATREAAEAKAPASSSSSTKNRVALIVVGVAIVSLIAWKLTAKDETPTTTARETPSTTSATPSATAAPTPTPTPTTATTATSATVATTAMPSATVATTASQIPSITPARTAAISTSTAKPASTPSTKPAAKPSASAQPAKIDENPF